MSDCSRVSDASSHEQKGTGLTLIREEGVEIHLLSLFLLAIPSRHVVVESGCMARGREKSSNKRSASCSDAGSGLVRVDG